MSFQIQRQIKLNAEQIRNYVTDLYDWQQQMTLKQQAKNKILKQERVKQEEIKKQLQKQIIDKQKTQLINQPTKAQKSVDLIRDSNTIKDYYTAWDKFNIDKQLSKLQQQQRRAYQPYNPYQNSQNFIRAKPKTKMNITIKNQRAAVIDPTELKDKGNIHFKVCEYEKAIDLYTQCMEKLNQQVENQQNNRLKCVVLSNRAMAYMKLNQNSLALRDCCQSLKYDSNYIKSYLRRGECYRKLGNYLESLQDFKRVKELDPNDKEIGVEIMKIQKHLERLYKEARESLVVQYGREVMAGSYRIPIEQVGQIGEVLGKSVKGKEGKVNYLQQL